MNHEKKVDTTEFSGKLEIIKQPDFAKNPHRLVWADRENFLKEFSDFQIRARITEDWSEYILWNYLPQMQKLLVLYESDKDNLDYFESVLHFYFSGELLFLVWDRLSDERHDDSDVRLALKQILAKINEFWIKEKLENNYFPPNEFLTYSLNFSDLENNHPEFISIRKALLLKKYIKHWEIESVENLISQDFPIYINYVSKILPLDNSISDELKLRVYKFILKNLKLYRYVFDNIERVYDNANHLENVIWLLLSALKTTIKPEILLWDVDSESIILNVNKLISIYYFQDLDWDLSVDQLIFIQLKHLNKNYKLFRTFFDQYSYLILSWQSKTMWTLEFEKMAVANVTLIHYLKGKKKKLISNCSIDEVNFIIRNLVYWTMATILFINDKNLDKTYSFNYVLSLLVPFNLLFSIFNEYFDRL